MREYQASQKPALQRRRDVDSALSVYTQTRAGRRVNVHEITCRLIRLGDNVEVTLIVPTWVAVGHYAIEPSTLEALPDGDYIAQWTFTRTPGGTPFRVERTFTIFYGAVTDQS